MFQVVLRNGSTLRRGSAMTRQTVAAAIIGIMGGALVAACGSSENGSSSARAENTFVLNEFSIVLPTNTLRPGRVTLAAKNVGSEVHELVIVRAASSDAVPKKSDGSLDEDALPQSAKVGAIEDVAAGSDSDRAFDLKAGRYLAFCNIIDAMPASSTGEHHGSSGPGHVHFAEGMYKSFTVG